MTQSIIVQVGQCGNQIGTRFWDLALREHAAINRSGHYDDALASFFRNVDSKGEDMPVGRGVGGSKVKSLRARAVLVDMEEGVLHGMLTGPLSHVFDHHQLVADVSGSGNNWATGYKIYGERFRESLAEKVRRAAEPCDCLQCFFTIHSLGGGTGSGLGTYILSLLEDDYPGVYRQVVAVFPSARDDVITSPYNTVLAMEQLTEHADCVYPLENQALIDICTRFSRGQGGGGEGAAVEEWPFDKMNLVVANMLLNLTAGSRFEGSVNVDLNEIATNLVPYPRLHYLLPSMTPACPPPAPPAAGQPRQPGLPRRPFAVTPARKFDQLFSDVFHRDYQMMKVDPRSPDSVYCACALMLRGNAARAVSDMRRNVDRVRASLRFVSWNRDAWKVGMCDVPPLGLDHSLLALANNSCVRERLSALIDRFSLLYRRKAHLHHYLNAGCDMQQLDDAEDSLRTLIDDYKRLENDSGHDAPRLKVMV